MSAAVILVPGKEITVLKGHPWIFPKAIAKVEGVNTGEWVAVYDSTLTLLAYGVYNEYSLYRVRVLCRLTEDFKSTDLAALVRHRLKQAIALRQLLQLPNELTNAYRVFNSEADGLSGLTIDRFSNYLVVSSTAFWIETHRELIQSLISEILPGLNILWSSHQKSLAQEGWLGESVWQEAHKTAVLEAGVIFNIDFASAQKTGLFLDQRDNHQRIAALSRGKSVLDLYCYSGGFALHAALAGASRVTAVDSSADAILKARENALSNHVNNIEFIEADARSYLENASAYDIVILDPPKLIPSKRHLEKAKNYYRFLHRELFKGMKSGSLLMTCNCSSALSSTEFTQLVCQQAIAMGRDVRLLGVFGPSLCHPVLNAFPEGQYLTAVLLAVV